MELISLVERMYSDDGELKQNVLDTLRIYDLDRPLMKNVGLGRIGFLKESMKISEVVATMKALLNQETMRLALAIDKSLGESNV